MLSTGVLRKGLPAKNLGLRAYHVSFCRSGLPSVSLTLLGDLRTRMSLTAASYSLFRLKLFHFRRIVIFSLVAVLVMSVNLQSVARVKVFECFTNVPRPFFERIFSKNFLFSRILLCDATWLFCYSSASF